MAEEDALGRLARLAHRDPIAKVALEMHRHGRSLADSLIAAVEAYSKRLSERDLEELDRLIEQPLPPAILVVDGSDIERIKFLFGEGRL